MKTLLLPTLLLVLACAPEPAVEPTAEPWIVFFSARSGDGDIYAIQPSTGETIVVVGTDVAEGGPRHDAHRDRIVFQRFHEDRTVLGTGDRELFVDASGDNPPVWSPNGEWIAYASKRQGQLDLYLAASDGSGERKLTDDPASDVYPAWSPDGGRLVFARRLESGWDLHTIDVTADRPIPVRLTSDGRYVGHPSWSPDGRFIAFDTTLDEQSDIAVLELATGEVTRVTDRPGNDLVPAWSPDGKRIAFGGVGAESGNWDLWLVDLEQGDPRRLTQHPGFDGAPVFVPAATIGR